MPDLEQIKREAAVAVSNTSKLLTMEDMQRRSKEMGLNSSQAASGAQKQLVLRLIAEGRTIGEAAKAVGRSRPCITRWLRDPEMREALMTLNQLAFEKIDMELKARAENTISRLNEAASDALDKVIELMSNADSETIQMRCAQDILDRNKETSKVHRVDTRSLNVNIDQKWLEAAAKAESEERQTVNG
jgi:hypothetical protein